MRAVPVSTWVIGICSEHKRCVEAFPKISDTQSPAPRYPCWSFPFGPWELNPYCGNLWTSTRNLGPGGISVWCSPHGLSPRPSFFACSLVPLPFLAFWISFVKLTEAIIEPTDKNWTTLFLPLFFLFFFFFFCNLQWDFQVHYCQWSWSGSRGWWQKLIIQPQGQWELAGSFRHSEAVMSN